MSPQSPPSPPPDSVTLALDPSRTWVFMVGNSAEWHEDRDRIGDERLHECLASHIIHKERIVFVKDKHATGKNVKRQFIKLLSKSNEGDALVVYYGGHGCEGYFCTNEQRWYHAEVVDAIEHHFKGSTAWILADCCHSGSFGNLLASHPDRRVSYLSINSTQAHAEARSDWTLTESMISAMEGSADIATTQKGYCTLENVIGYMANETARIKKDLMTVYMDEEGIIPNAAFPRLDQDRIAPHKKAQRRLVGDSSCCFHQLLQFFQQPSYHSALSSSSSSSSEDSNSCFVGVAACSVGDVVHAKWHGGRPTPNSPYLLPVWFRGTVIAVNGDSVQVELRDPFRSFRWTCRFKRQELLDETYFDWHEFCKDEHCIETHCRMARQLKFYSHALAGGTRVQVLWKDDKLYGATVMSRDNVNWTRLVRENEPMKEFDDIVGAFVPVSWDGEDTWDVMPLSYCVLEELAHGISGLDVRENARAEAAREALAITTPRQAMMRSFQSTGKIICTHLESSIGSRLLTCFWKDSGEWFPARTAELSELSFEALADHLHYNDSGGYCAVCWDEDGSFALLPRRYVRKRL